MFIHETLEAVETAEMLESGAFRVDGVRRCLVYVTCSGLC